MREYKGIKVITEPEFDNQCGGNWMITDHQGKYNKVPFEMFIIEECKDTKGKRSITPYIAVDNTEGCCWKEDYATIDEAVYYLKGENDQ